MSMNSEYSLAMLEESAVSVGQTARRNLAAAAGYLVLGSAVAAEGVVEAHSDVANLSSYFGAETYAARNVLFAVAIGLGVYVTSLGVSHLSRFISYRRQAREATTN